MNHSTRQLNPAKALLWALLLMLLTGCGGTAALPSPTPTPSPTATPLPTPFVLTVSVGTEGSTLDPTYLTDPDPADYISHLFEGLMKYAPADTAAPVVDSRCVYGLAEAAEVSPDGLRWRFTLRADARWSDGAAITAGDFVYAWRRLLTPADAGETAHAAGAAQLHGIVRNAAAVAAGELPPEALGVTAESDRVLVVDLEQPCPWFGRLCAMPCMAPLRRDCIEGYGGDWTNEQYLVVSGPYTITEWVHDAYMRLDPNPYYYDAEALGPDAIIWRFDGVDADFTAAVPDADATGSVDVAGTYYLYLNANAIRDWRVRAAMTLSIDREGLASAVGEGARPAEGLVPGGISCTDGAAYAPDTAPMYAWAAAAYPDYDLTSCDGRCALAQRLMNEARAAGTWHSGYTVYYRFNESTVNRLVAERCRDDWQQVLGLTAELVPMALEDYGTRLRSNTFDTAYLSWLPDYDDALSFLRIMERGGVYNHSGWGDVRYNEQLELAAATLDAAARDALLRHADEMLFEAERFAVCPLYWFGENYAADEALRGVGHSSVMGYYFGYSEK